MDPQERQRKQMQLDQATAFTRLSSHGDWPMFRSWVEKARADYERQLHDPNERTSPNMARWAEGYDAINNLLVAMDKAMLKIGPLTKELEDDANGRTDAPYNPTTGRRIS